VLLLLALGLRGWNSESADERARARAYDSIEEAILSYDKEFEG